MAQNTLSDFVEQTATNFEVPGVAVGVWADDQESYACRGVTSIDNPLPVDQDTLYVLGSVTKTYQQATTSLIFEPLGLSHRVFEPNDVMLRRFAVGHNRGKDGALSVVQQWNDTRGNRPGGGLASSVSDQVRWGTSISQMVERKVAYRFCLLRNHFC